METIDQELRNRVVELLLKEDWEGCSSVCREAIATASLRDQRWLMQRLAISIQLSLESSEEQLLEALDTYHRLFEGASTAEAAALHRKIGHLYWILGQRNSTNASYLQKAALHYEESLREGHQSGLVLASVAVQLASICARLGCIDLAQGERAREYLYDALTVFRTPELSAEYEEALQAKHALEGCLRDPNARAGALTSLSSKGRINIILSHQDLLGQLEERDSDGCTPLHLAVAEGNVNTAALLIQKGASLKARDDQGFTVLHWAVFSDDPRLLALSFEAIVGPSPQDLTGRTPLTWAISLGMMRSLEWLISHDADLSIADDDGWTPMHYAAASGSESIVRRLLDAGANSGCRSREGELPSEVARRLGHLALVPLLAARN